MKSLRKLLYIIPLTGMMVTSCMDVENIEIVHIRRVCRNEQCGE